MIDFSILFLCFALIICIIRISVLEIKFKNLETIVKKLLDGGNK